MSKQLVADLSVEQPVDAAFVVREKTLSTFANKPGRYLNLTLGDVSGEIGARVWDNAEDLVTQFETGDIVSVRGRIDNYQGKQQLIVQQIERLPLEDVDLTDFVPHSRRNREEMLEELWSTIGRVDSVCLRALLEVIFGDEELLERFSRSPGAKTLHHAFLGGLMEHTLNVARMCECAAASYEELNRDLLLAAALLHDIGKCYELSGDLSFSYTNLGNFVGHVVLTDRLVCDKMREVPEFPPQVAELLTHLLLSHHGQREWGAPIQPAIPEAAALHYADNLDARVQGFLAVRASAGPGEGNWSRHHHLFGGSLYLGPISADGPADEGEAANGEPG